MAKSAPIDFSDLDVTMSKTEKKKAMLRLQAMAAPLAQLSKKNIRNLPASEFFIDELLALQHINSHEAKKRHIKRIGKLLGEEDNTAGIIGALFTIMFSPEQQAKILAWHSRLNLQDPSTLKLFNKQFKLAEYNTIEQYLIQQAYAVSIADDNLILDLDETIRVYIQQVAILSR